jgi:hypothetical protein
MSAGSLANSIGCGTIWKSPRDRSRAIEARLREFNGNAFAEFRLMQMSEQGRMVPTGKGLIVSTAQLGKFAKLVGDAYRKADAMHLVAGGSS